MIIDSKHIEKLRELVAEKRAFAAQTQATADAYAKTLAEQEAIFNSAKPPTPQEILDFINAELKKIPAIKANGYTTTFHLSCTSLGWSCYDSMDAVVTGDVHIVKSIEADIKKPVPVMSDEEFAKLFGKN